MLQKGVRVEIIRLLAKAEFKAKDGWTDPYIAIVDTGAPLSLIPQSIWEGCEVEILAEHSLKGVLCPEKSVCYQSPLGKFLCGLWTRRI